MPGKDRGRKRALLGRLDNDRVAGDDCWRDPRCRETNRMIERDDTPDDFVWNAPCHLNVAGARGIESPLISKARPAADFIPETAVVTPFRIGRWYCAAWPSIVLPTLEMPAQQLNSPVHVASVAERYASQLGSCRIDGIEPFAINALDELAIDQHFARKGACTLCPLCWVRERSVLTGFPRNHRDG